MVYFDNAATTPVPKAVADAMYEVLTAHFGNPSSQYPIGVEMKKAVEGWRAVIAGALGCPAERLYFTSCGTESDNWAIQAALWQNRHRGRHIITTAVEHSAVLEPCKLLAQQGYEVTYLKPGRDGNVTAEQVADALREDTALVSVMLVNNETGCVFPAADIAALLREKGSPALLHCDAVQGFLKRELLTLLPEADFFGEEGEHPALTRPWVFVVDPIDGTTNFTRRMNYSSISVALVHNGQTEYGVVYNPYVGELFAARRGHGATLNGAPIHVSGNDVPHAIVVCGSTIYDRTYTDRNFSILRRLYDEMTELCQPMMTLATAIAALGALF